MPRVEVRYGGDQLAELVKAAEAARGRTVTSVRTVVTELCDAYDRPTGAYRVELVAASAEGTDAAGAERTGSG